MYRGIRFNGLPLRSVCNRIPSLPSAIDVSARHGRRGGQILVRRGEYGLTVGQQRIAHDDAHQKRFEPARAPRVILALMSCSAPISSFVNAWKLIVKPLA